MKATYMDDSMDSVKSDDDAIQLYEQLVVGVRRNACPKMAL